jgi:MFS family permease
MLEDGPQRPASDGFSRTLAPLVGIVFVEFLVSGLALPVLPLHIRQRLGFGTFIVGLVAGAQFGVALLSRLWSGGFSDTRGAKPATFIGLVMASMAGLFYLLSLQLLRVPLVSVAILLLGRALLGGAESFVIMGALTWGLAIAGSRHTGRVMAWVGLAMYVAFAVGAPLGTELYAAHGFRAIALATALIPMVAIVLIAPLRAVAPVARSRPPLTGVVNAVWMPGLGLAFASAGFAAITTFVVLFFVEKGWAHGWLGVTLFATAFVVGRVGLGHLPDRKGGLGVAFASLLIEAVGLTLIWVASTPTVALLGATIAGLGYTLVYPGFGVEAMSRAPAENRGLAMGAYTAFLDLSLGVGNPTLGLVAARAGVGVVFPIAAILALFAAALSLTLMGRRERSTRAMAPG